MQAAVNASTLQLNYSKVHFGSQPPPPPPPLHLETLMVIQKGTPTGRFNLQRKKWWGLLVGKKWWLLLRKEWWGLLLRNERRG